MIYWLRAKFEMKDNEGMSDESAGKGESQSITVNSNATKVNTMRRFD